MLTLARFAVTLVAVATQTPTTTWAGATPGLDPVGVTSLADAGRVAAIVWRPVLSALPPIALGDLARLACPEPATEPAASVVERCLGTALGPAAAHRLYAGAGGRPVAARLPVVLLYGSLNGKGIELTGLAETLASHGYLVAAIAAPAAAGVRAFDEASVRAARGAVRSTLDALRRDPGVDLTRVALVAWSFGGVPMTLEALADPSVRALVSLDSALRYQYGADLIRASAGDRLAAFRGALLSLSAGVDNTVSKDERLIDGLVNATVTRQVAQDMSHADFADAHGAMGALTKPAAEQMAFRQRYGRTVTQIVAWLREVLPPARRAG